MTNKTNAKEPKRSKKTGPLFTRLDRYDHSKHSEMVPALGGVLGVLDLKGRADSFRLIQQRQKLPAACSAMGIPPEDPCALEQLLLVLCAEKWPKAFSDAPEKRKKRLTKKQQVALGKINAAFDLYLNWAGKIHKATGKMPQVKAVAEAILKGGNDKYADGLDVTAIFQRPGVKVTSYKGKHVRVIPIPQAGGKPNGFFAGITEWAKREDNTALLDHISLNETGGALSAKGPVIAPFISSALKSLAIRTSAKGGDALLFIAGPQAKAMSKLARRVRTEIGARLGVNFDQFAGLEPTKAYGGTVEAVLARINRVGKENRWQPVKELERWGHDISKLTASVTLQPLDKLADCDEHLTIVGTSKTPIGWSIYQRMLTRGGNVDIVADFTPGVMADFEAMVSEAENERDFRGRPKNPAGLVLLDASPNGNDYILRMQQHLAECGLKPRLVKDARFCFPARITNIASDVPRALPRLGGHPFYLINLRAYVPPSLLNAERSEMSQDEERPTSYQARQREKTVAEYMRMATSTSRGMMPFGGGGLFGNGGQKREAATTPSSGGAQSTPTER